MSIPETTPEEGLNILRASMADLLVDVDRAMSTMSQATEELRLKDQEIGELKMQLTLAASRIRDLIREKTNLEVRVEDLEAEREERS